jgi:hypothetical protein
MNRYSYPAPPRPPPPSRTALNARNNDELRRCVTQLRVRAGIMENQARDMLDDSKAARARAQAAYTAEDDIIGDSELDMAVSYEQTGKHYIVVSTQMKQVALRVEANLATGAVTDTVRTLARNTQAILSRNDPAATATMLGQFESGLAGADTRAAMTTVSLTNHVNETLNHTRKDAWKEQMLATRASAAAEAAGGLDLGIPSVPTGRLAAVDEAEEDTEMASMRRRLEALKQ